MGMIFNRIFFSKPDKPSASKLKKIVLWNEKKTIFDDLVEINIKYVRAASKKKDAICFSHLYSRCENILFEILQGKLDLGRFPHHISIKEASSADLVWLRLKSEISYVLINSRS